MLIVDAQIHLWGSGVPTAPHRPVPSFTAEEALAEMDRAGVHAALIHPPSWDPSSNTMAEAAAQKYPERFAIMGQFPLDKPESRGLIEGWKSRPGQLGLRWALIQPQQAEWHRDGTMDWVWPEAEKAGVPIALLAGRFLPELRVLALKYPNLKLIIDHLGLTRRQKDEAAFRDNILDLVDIARLPNVAMKATGAPAYSSSYYPYRNIHDNLHRLFDAYGPDRFFWGTDITRMPCSWRRCVSMFTEELPWLKGRDLERVMGRAVCDWLGWNLPDPR
jgi:predicted TIM-barrel fold metal-dependent hydrolase